MQHLKSAIQLKWVNDKEFAATVTTQVIDSCYKPVGIQHGLPQGAVGLSEMAYIVAELKHEGEACAQIVTDVVQQIQGIHSLGKTLGVTVFVVVNGEIVGTAHQQFPKSPQVAGLDANEPTQPKDRVLFPWALSLNTPHGVYDGPILIWPGMIQQTENGPGVWPVLESDKKPTDRRPWPFSLSITTQEGVKDTPVPVIFWTAGDRVPWPF